MLFPMSTNAIQCSKNMSTPCSVTCIWKIGHHCVIIFTYAVTVVNIVRNCKTSRKRYDEHRVIFDHSDTAVSEEGWNHVSPIITAF